MNVKANKGFTLVEILVVVALIAILAAITIIAINPAKNFADTRNAQRSSDVGEILSAVTQYTSEEGHAIGDFVGISANCDVPSVIGTGAIDLDATLVDEYIVAIPTDPRLLVGGSGTDADTGYTICTSGTSRVQIAAPNAENGAIIIVKQ